MNINNTNIGIVLAVIALILAVVLAVVGQMSPPIAGMFALLAFAIIVK